MKKVLFCLLPLALLCVVSLTGCNLFDEKETSKQASTEENSKDKESENEEESKGSTKDEEEKSKSEKSETSNQASSSKENSVAQPKEASKKATTSQVDWGDAWTRDIQFDHALLEITQKSGNTFSFKLQATNAMNAEAVKRGAVNVGEVTGTAKVEGDVATQTVADPDTGCQIKMTNYTGYIQVEPVTDCSGAAGVRVHFDGKYKKGNIPEPEIAVEENDDNFEPSEDDAQNNNEEATEDNSQNGVESDSANQTEGDNEGSNSSEGSAQPISKEEARQLVVNYLHPDDPESIIEYDHDDNGDYIFHYYKVIDDGTDTAHTATTGWYGINPYTKEIYDYMAAMD